MDYDGIMLKKLYASTAPTAIQAERTSMSTSAEAHSVNNKVLLLMHRH